MTTALTRRLLLATGATAFGSTLFGAVPALAADPAVTAIQNYYARLVATMREASGLSVSARYQRLAPILASAFDFGTMTRLSVGPEFNRASAAQKAQLRQAFERFTGAYYANRIDGYSGEQFKVDPTPEVRGGQKIVKTQLVTSGGSAQTINYLMSGSKVVDIYLDGSISEVASRRGEFSSIMATGGPDALIRALQEKSARLLGTA